MKYLPSFDKENAKAEARQGYLQKQLMLQGVFANNNEIFEAGGYISDSGNEVYLPDAVEAADATIVYSKPLSTKEILVCGAELETDVFNADCLDIAKEVISEGYNPAMLNLASGTHAGGGYHHGARAQEEGICRASTLSQTLYQYYKEDYADAAHIPFKGSAYPMNLNYGGIYSPKVTVFRNPNNGLALIDDPWQVSVISVAALNFGGWGSRFKAWDGGFTPAGEEIMKNKIRTIYRIGLLNGHDALVLGAFGCGAFHLPPASVAALFKEVLLEEEFAGKYRKIVFAILEHGYANSTGVNGKFKPFYNIFGKK